MPHDVEHRIQEPLRGLPELPPEDEHILWQGAPSWRGIFWRVLGFRLILVWFGAIGLWRTAQILLEGGIWQQIVLAVLPLSFLATLVGAMIAAIAWGVRATTVYTITTRRVVLRFGIAIRITLNLPYRWIGAAALARHGDGTGDIPLETTGETHLAYVMLWPHARPWLWARPEPSLRALPEAGAVATLLARALRAYHGQLAETEAETGTETGTDIGTGADVTTAGPRPASRPVREPLVAAE
ncbi:MAG: photosynthetic complex putative assembly protein PuhB [Paracoccaceae bacterium]